MKFYYLATKSGHEIEITDVQHDALVKIKQKGSGAALIGGEMVDAGEISGIFDKPKARKGLWFCDYRNWHADREPCQCGRTPKEGRSLLESKRCYGTRSIQWAVHEIAVAEGIHWPQLVQDKVWREKVRQFLRQGDEEWCDYRANNCIC